MVVPEGLGFVDSSAKSLSYDRIQMAECWSKLWPHSYMQGTPHEKSHHTLKERSLNILVF